MTQDGYTPTIKQVGDDPYGPFILETGDGREFEVGNRMRLYSSFAALDSMYGPFPLFEDDESVPIKIAVEGSAALATYLMMVYTIQQDMVWKDSLNKTADRLDVQEYTVRKYLNRVRNRL